jgi:hypothetical protein
LVTVANIVNPWRLLPLLPPYALAEDARALDAFSARAAHDKRYDLSLFPEPFFGSLSAPVLLLALNPGWSPNDASVHGQPWFAEQSRRSLAHELGKRAVIPS